MTEEQLTEIRQRIQEIEDQDFAKKANTLLDEIIANDQALLNQTRNLNEFIERFLLARCQFHKWEKYIKIA